MEKSKLMFLVLTICGTLCVLLSLVTVACLYHQHAPEFAHDKDAMVPFALFAAVPSVAGFVVGGILAATGISIGLKDRS